MSLVQPPPVPERKPSPQFGSNNPFRNRASQIPPFSPASPISPTSADPFAPPQRPQSRNPFLDVFADDDDLLDPPARSLHKANSFDASSTQRPKLTGAAAELFENLTITDHDNKRESKSTNQGNNGPNRDAMKPSLPPGQLPSFKGRPPPPPPAGHRHSKSSEVRPPTISGSSYPAGRPPHQPSASSGNRIAPSSGERPRLRQRRNSDSSIMDVHEIDRERAKERERRERKAKEARAAGESGSSRDKDERRPSKSVGRSRKGSPLDIIDKLDVTGIYGSGLFHHDGPFDACNPHRNRNSRRAPMKAFPADSANNALTGFGPMPEKGDHAHLFGNRDPEAYADFNMSAGRRGSSDDVLKRPSTFRATSFDPISRVEPVHGDETLGLGSSTFLDGAPASKKAILQQISEAEQAEAAAAEKNSGLGRKKSLSHKIRGLSGGRPRFNADGTSRRRESDEGLSPVDSRYSPTGAPTIPRRKNENNPPNDYDAAYDRKTEAISVDYEARRERAPSSPKKPLNGDANGGTGGSLMKRVRSLSKPKKKNEA